MISIFSEAVKGEVDSGKLIISGKIVELSTEIKYDLLGCKFVNELNSDDGRYDI